MLFFVNTTTQRWRKKQAANKTFSFFFEIIFVYWQVQGTRARIFFHFGNEFYLIDWLLNYRRMTRWKTKKKLSRKGKNCFRWLNNLERVGFCWVLQFTGSFIHWASHSETFSEAHPTWTCRYLRSLGEISFYFYSFEYGILQIVEVKFRVYFRASSQIR